MANNKLISSDFNATAIAHKYYNTVKPERGYTPKEAMWQFRQDKNINQRVLETIVQLMADKQLKQIAKYFAELKRK